ncbi:hypothetical protein KL930_000479 [Ogataea haglerorum]|uniref:Transcriptional repressor Tup1 N-terminal domain-containing protein n=1 Tax=Ogataea haglerorum TaxID=1937702 RepID=A0ABQ7RDC5_9ASCO|nr:uncharacterized protein KL911_000652 [Ogataea haglerorum]KAG7693466.1 hypothetical protein KL951_004487 [Ogataea haglerorum]KAG7701068.1 hypothetical protein KL915_000099 [Ogataea haglerorum]KAG7709026.1 hypothetical protein KL914_001416 [Ogataea haglerorum]KAG7713636.1 hypothetical protein KL913_004976 [Ogataea haglerorum]KAG7714068.1 hypothetical protein KL949_004923 [Ogataea haglerorum]
MPERERLDELLDAVKKEFDNLTRETTIYKDHHHDYELKINQQHQELTNIRNTVYELEQAHRTMKEAYEKEILRLKQDLENRDRLFQQQSLQQAQAQAQAQAQVKAQVQSQQHPLLDRPQGAFPQTPQQLPPPNLSGSPSDYRGAGFNGALPQINAQASGAKPEISQSSQLPPPPPVSTQEQQAASQTQPSPEQPPAAIQTSVVKSEVEDAGYVMRSQHNKPIPAFLKDFDSYSSLPYKKQHSEYYIVYNPKVPKKVDTSLVHSFDHTSVVCCVRFSKDGKFLATGCNKLTQVFSVETGDLVARLSDESSASSNGSYDTDTGDLYIRSVCFSPDGKFLATGAEDKIIRIWDLATRTIVKYLKGHEQDIYSLDFFPDGSKLVSGSGDRTVRIWDVFTGQCSLTLSIEDGVTTVAASPDGKLIAAGSLDRTVRVWDANHGFLVERLDSANESGNGHMDSVYSVAFTHDGKDIASGSLDRTVKLWSLKDLQKQQGSSKSNCEVTYVGHKDFVLSVCCTPDDEFILSGSKDRGVIMWEKATGEPYIMLQGHRNSVISVNVSPVMTQKRGVNGGYFATGSGDCKARIWRWEKVSS